MQIIVLGMHRSGTSAVIRLLNMMGAYLGPPETVKGANRENPKGFWENEQIVEIDKKVLGAQGCLWNRLATFDSAKLHEEKLATARRRARDVIVRLDACRPWAVKDPRMCLLMPFWRPMLEVPVCVLVHRNPMEVAMSLATRNRIPLTVGVALWELHLLEALRGSAGLPRRIIQYEHLLAHPVETVRELCQALGALGVRKLECPPEREITAFVDPTLHREQAQDDRIEAYLTRPQRWLHEALADGSAMQWTEVPPLSDAAGEILSVYDSTLLLQEDLERCRQAAPTVDSDAKPATLEASAGRILAELSEIKRRITAMEQALNQRD